MRISGFAKYLGGVLAEDDDPLDVLVLGVGQNGHLGFNEVDQVRSVPTDATHLHLEIPPNIANLKTYGPTNSAVAWQQAIRTAFLTAFAAGFVAVGFSRADPHRPKYLLERSR